MTRERTGSLVKNCGWVRIPARARKLVGIRKQANQVADYRVRDRRLVHQLSYPDRGLSRHP